MKRYICRVLACVACVAFMGLLCVIGASAESSEFGGAFTINNAYMFAWATDAQADLSNRMYSEMLLSPFAITAVGEADQFKYYVYTCVDGYKTPADLGDGESLATTVKKQIWRYDYSNSNGMNRKTYMGNVATLQANEQVVMFRDSLGSWVHNAGALTSGYLMSNTVDQPTPTIFSSWYDALQGFQGVWNGETISERVETARKNGYDKGVEAGKAEGYANAKAEFNNDLKEEVSKALKKGWNDAMKQYKDTGSTAFWIDIPAVINAYVTGVGELIDSVLGFELFGINIAGVFGAIIATLVLAFVVGLILKLFGLLL